MNAIRGKLSDHAAKGYSKIDAYEHDLHQIYLRARNRIETELSNFMQRRGASFTGPRLVSLFDDLNEMFPEFEEEYRETYEHALEYMAHQNYAAALLDMGLEKSVVGTMDKSLFENMRQDGFQHIAGATRNMQAEVISNLRKMSAQVMREAALTGMTRQEVSRRLAFENGYGVGSYFQQEGRRGSDFQFVDAGGRRWKTEKYFNMLGRTLLHNNARECYLAGCAKAGSDIVTISVSGDCCDACGKYENALLSISGATPGLPTLEEAMAEGLFHPNCTHRIIAVPESIARKYYGLGEGGKKPEVEKPTAQTNKTGPARQTKPEKKDANLPENLDNLKTIRSLGGTTGAKLVEDQYGNQFVYKTGGTAGGDPSAHLRNEAAADNFYRAAGFNVPECKIYETTDGPVKLSRYIDGGTSLHDYWQQATPEQKEQLIEKLRPGFDADVLIGNWDVTGTGADNILIDKNGTPWRIDNGGALGFRAQGSLKKTEEWFSGWPDDLWSMRTSTNNAPFFGQINTLDLCSSISDRNWDKAIAALPDADQKIVRKRLEEIHQLAARGKDFASSGYTESNIEIILSDSYELSKAGLREKMRCSITLGGDHLPTEYGPFRSFLRKPSAVPINSNAKKDQKIKDTVIAAAKTINLHNGKDNGKPGAGDHKPNQATLDAAIALKPELEKLADSGNAGAMYYLRKIEQIETAAHNDTTIIGKPVGDVSVYVTKKARAVSAAAQQNQSFTSMVFDHISSKHVNYKGKDIPLEPTFITVSQKSQGGDSYNYDACKMKIVRLNALGIKPSEAEKRGYFIGLKKKNWKDAVDYYKKNPAEFARDTETYVRYQSALSIALENTTMPGNDPKSRSMILARTEDDKVVSTSTPGGELKAKHGVNESHSMFRTTVVTGDNLTMVRVPYSRISGTFMAESRPGSNSCAYLGDSENEADADTNGLRVLFVGKVQSGEDLEKYRRQYLAWENNNYK